MVSPIYIFIIALGIGFLLSLFDKAGRAVAMTIFYGALLAMAFISGQWLLHLLQGAEAEIITTAGFQPPFSINLKMGLLEAFFTFLINTLGFLAGIYLLPKFKSQKIYGMILFLMLIMGLNGLVMTGDMFNLFVFLEITSIATVSIIAIEKNLKSISAGFKYVIAGGIASAFYLIATIFLYRFTGVLNIAMMAETLNVASSQAVFLSVFILMIAVIVELKPFPANGWALDAYEAVDSGVVAVIASGTSAAMLFVFYKISPLLNNTLLLTAAGIGLATFTFSNLLALKQKNAKRLLGYSSIGQIGLIITAYALLVRAGYARNSEIVMLTTGGLFINHFLAKAGLFWLSGVVEKEKLEEWSTLRNNPILLFAFAVFVIALVGLPPFPGFFAKWQLVMTFANQGLFFWIGLILLGSFLEAIYLFRWLGKVLKSDLKAELKAKISQIFPILIYLLAILIGGGYLSRLINQGTSLSILYLPVLFIVFLFFIDFLPVAIKNTLVILVGSYYTYLIIPQLSGYRVMLGVIFLAGGVLLFIPGYFKRGKRTGFYPLAVMMYVGLAGLLISENTLQFFTSWELMTLGSYFLIIRGKKSEPHALSYMLFSIGGAFVMLFGFGILYYVNGNSMALSSLGNIESMAGIIYALLGIAFLTKMASIGLHIWLPGAYGEAEADVSPMLSAILSKAGMFGLLMLMAAIQTANLGSINLPYVLGWLGAITVFIGNLLAIYQEDAKRLLAYSSVGNLGYILFGLALMSHMGWLTSITYALNHFLFKALLFLAIGGVVYRVKTKNMYEMGGLIKKMPLSFVSVLIGIIALSGVPPLSGFAGKWLTYNAVLEKGWYLQGVIVIIGGLIAFLYCFRLIYAVFLGQLKDKHRQVKEAPVWFLIPQVILIGAIMLFSTYPAFILGPVGKMLNDILPENALIWENLDAYSIYGHWNGFLIMMITGGIFVIVFLWLYFLNRKAQKVKQFNIVYAAERPSRPELTHVGYNFFAHYKKALGSLSQPYVTKFWNTMADIFHSSAGFIRRIYTGDGQTYILHIIIFIVVVYFLTIGG
ncbi:MAG: NADH-quinone oxidoreductase subunit F [Candidatus Marinimicrobia bacterium]|nr:NADH-quinone oxidoreductase subunit F [Candidatus Neomarinimicrobiota bacterium]